MDRNRARAPFLAAAALVAGLIAPAVASATDGLPPTCSDASFTTNEDAAHPGTLACADPDPFTVAVGTDPTHGSVIIAGDGTFTYTPDADFNGLDSFTFRASDGDGISTDATVSVTVDPVNDAPSFTKGSNETVLEDAGAQSFPGWATGLRAGPSDEAGQALTFVVESALPNLFSAGPAVSPDGTLTFTPAANANGTATVKVHVEDDGGTANGGVDAGPTQTFTITITAVNDQPSFTKGADQVVDENAGAVSIPWATSISRGAPDETGQAVNFVVTGDSNAALFSVPPAVSSTGILAYTIAPSATGAATITLHIHDNGGVANGGDDTGADVTFTITVTGINDAPSFTKGSDQTDLEDAGPQTVPGWATGISPGPPDESGQALDFVVDTNSRPGLFSAGPSISPTGTLTYTPASNANGSATITIHLHDDGGTANGGINASPSQTFVINVTAVNDAPSFTKGPDQSVGEGAGAQTVTGWATDISRGAPDESGQNVNFQVSADQPNLFSAGPSISPTGTLTYAPAANANGSATVTVRIHDTGGSANAGVNTSGPQTFTITIGAVNDPPSFTKGPNQVDVEDAGAQTVVGWATAISAGPADEVGQTLDFTVDGNTNPALFALEPAVDSTGTLTYTPTANAHGIATITVSLHDDGGTVNGGNDTSAPQTFTITVATVNDAPSFTKDADQVDLEDAGAQAVVGWATASAGPPDESGQTMNYVIDSNSNVGLFSVGPAISATGTLTYTPAANANGSATIIIHVHDSGGTASGGVDSSPPQSFTITITPVNDQPGFTKGADGSVVEDAGTQVVPGWATALSKGPNESGQILTFVIDTDSNAALFAVEPAVSAAGTLTYTSAGDAHGSATISLHVEDNGGTLNGGIDKSPAQSFTISVASVNDPPSFSPGTAPVVLEDTGAQIFAGWANAISPGPPDESGQAVSFALDSNTDPNMFSVEPALAPDGTLTFTPGPDENGIATITVHAVDNGGSLNGGSDSGPGVPFTITVQPVNDLPTCANVGMATSQGAALTGQLTCADVDGDTIHYHKLSGPSHGSATVNDDGTFSYQPVPSFVNAADTITFRVDDSVVTSNTATLTINVEPDPTAHNDLSSVIQGTGPNAIDVLANDVDRDPGDSLKIVSVSQGSRGKVAITGSGTGLSYDPTALVTGTDSFTYTIQDTTARASQAVVFVTIVRDTLKPVAVIPIASIVSPSALGSTTLSARISWSATDVGSGVKSYQLQESVSGSLFHSVALSRASARSVVRMLSRSRTYRYRVRAVDVVGNVGGWAVGPTFGFGRYQETAGSITYAGSWRLHSSSSYFGGKVRASTAAGATATFTFTGRAVAWVAAKGPTRGVARVYVDGVIVSSVNLRSSTSAYRRVVFGRAWPSAGTHTVMVQVAGTAGHPRVDVDAFIVIR